MSVLPDLRFLPHEILGALKSEMHAMAEKRSGSPMEFIEKVGIDSFCERFFLHISNDKNDSPAKWRVAFIEDLVFMCERLNLEVIGLPPVTRVPFARALLALQRLLKHPPRIPEGKDGPEILLVAANTPLGNVSEVGVIWKSLHECRDLPQADKWPELAFLKSEDAPLWERLGAALSDAHAALSHNQYRAATVVSVYVMESLLGYWLHRQLNAGKINKIDFELTKKIEQTQTRGLFSADASVSKYDKPEIECLFQSCTQAAAYRNLIHPDKAKRTGADHDQGTANFCLGTVLKLAQRIEQAP